MQAFTLPTVFHVANYRKFWFMRQMIACARQMVTIIIGWQVYDLARTAIQDGGLGWDEPKSILLVGFVGAVQFVPIFLLSLYGGQAADQFDRKRILIISQIIRVAVILCLCTTPFLPVISALYVIFGCSAVMGAVNAFVPAASNALYPTLVSRDLLPSAVVWNSIGSQSARIVGPMIGGILLIFGEEYAYGLSALLIAMATIILSRIDAPQIFKLTAGGTLNRIKDGLRYIRSNHMVMGAITLDFVVVFFAGAMALLPVFARDILHVGEEGYGIMRAAPAIGATCVSIALSIRPVKRRVGLWMFGSAFIFGLSVLLFGLSKSFWLSVFALVIYGGSDMISMYIRQSIIQLSTPDDMKGRVSSVSSIFVAGTNELGEFQSGIAGRLIGPVGAVLLGGVVAITSTGIWQALFPQLRDADTFEGIKERK